MDSVEVAIIFLVVGLGLSAAEILAPGLVLLPFGIGGVIAAISGFIGAPPLAQAVIFIASSVVMFLALRPVGRRLNESDADEGVGARRLTGAHGVVLEDIAANDVGLIRIDRETWRAEAPDDGPLVAGSSVVVTEVRGTRLIVTPATIPGLASPTRPPEQVPPPVDPAGTDPPTRNPPPGGEQQ